MLELKTKIQKFSRVLMAGLLVVAFFAFKISTASAAYNFWGWLDFGSDSDSTDFIISASNTVPFAPVLVSPATASFTSDSTPTLSAAYSDNDVGDVGTVHYRISSSGLDQCLAGTDIVASGTSSQTLTNAYTETTWTPESSIGDDQMYYWCAQNDDGVATSSWTAMGTFTLDTIDPVVSNLVISSDSSYFYESDTDLTGDNDAIYFNSLAGEGADQSITITLTTTETNPDSASGETAFGDSPSDEDDENTQTLLYSIEADATTFNNLTVTVVDKAVNSKLYDIDFIADNTDPTGGSITYSTQFLNSLESDPAVVVDDGSDAGAGIDTASRTLKRATATLTGGSCGEFGSYSTTTIAGTYPNLTDTGAITTATCYRYAWVVADNAGNEATFTSENVFKVDTSTPDIVAVDAGASSSDRTSLTSATWFKSSDAGDDDEVSFSWTDSGSTSDDIFYYELNSSSEDSIDGSESSVATNYLDEVSISEGTNYFHVRPKTVAGTFGTERIFTVKYDKTDPTTSAEVTSGTLGENDWYTTNIEATITPADATSGVVSTVYCTDTVNTCTPTTDYSTALTISTEGTHYLRYFSTDNAGNIQTTQSLTIKIDKTAPTDLTLSYLDDFTATTPQDITFTAVDAISTVASFELFYKSATLAGGTCSGWDESWTTLGTQSSPYSHSLTNAKCYKYKVIATNGAGLTTTKDNSTEVIKFDSSTPDIVAVDAGASSSDRTSLTSATWFKSSDAGDDDKISFSWTDPSSASDDSFYYELNATATATIDGSESSVATNYLDEVSISEGTNYFHVRPKTVAGTFGTERIFIVKYDKTDPVLTDLELTSDENYFEDAGTPVTSGLVGYWKMDESSWAGTTDEVVDYSGQGNHGTAAGGATTATGGKFGKAGDFDGEDDYIALDDNIADLSEDCSASFWVKVSENAETQNPRFLSLIDTDDNFQIGMMGDSGSPTTNGLYVRFDDATNTTTTALTKNDWAHVVWTKLNGSQTFYINGTVIATASGGITSNANFSAIGAGYDTDSYSANGLIDDVAIYDRALTVEEITNIYTKRVAYFNSLVAEGSGQSITVATGADETNPASWICASAFGDTPSADTAAPFTQVYSVETDAATQSDKVCTFTDHAGNTATTSLTFTQDNVDPTAVTPSDEGAYSTDSILNFTWTAVSDAGTGLASLTLCIDDDKTSTCVKEVSLDLSATGYDWSELPAPTADTNYFAKLTAVDRVGNSTTTDWSDGVAVDGTDPTGGSVEHFDGFQNTATIAVTVDRGSDAGIGMSTDDSDYLLEYRSATLTTGSCGSYGSWTDSAVSETAGAENYDFTATTGNCYQFRYTVADIASNTATWTSDDTTKVDTSTPDIVAVDAGASSSDRTSLTSATWFKSSDAGDDDEVSFSWTDPSSASDDNFYYDYVDEDLVGWWQMDSDWTDSSGNSNDGTAYNGATFTTSGKIASGGSFDGEDDYIDCGNDTSFNDAFNDSFTLSMWLYDTSPAPDGVTNYNIFYKADNANFVNNSIWLYKLRQNGVYTFTIRDSNSVSNGISFAAPSETGAGDSTWHHYVTVFDRNGQKGYNYKDGAQVNSINLVSQADITNSGAVTIGNHYSHNGAWDGGIDEVKIYNRALSADEIAAEYARGTPTTTNYIDEIPILEGEGDFHVRPKTVAGTFGTERIFSVNYDKTNPTVETDTLTSPNGGEVWTGGGSASYDITWTAEDFTDSISGLGATPISIDYSTNSGTDWISITTDEANDGIYSWTTPNISDSEIRIRVTATDTAGNTASDTSDVDFRLVAHNDFIALHIVEGNNQIGEMDSVLSDELKVRVGNGADSGEIFAGADDVEITFTLYSVPETPTAVGQILSNGSFGTEFGGTPIVKTVTTDANGYASVDLTLGDRAGDYTVVANFTGCETAVADRTFTATEREIFKFTIASPDINIDVNPFITTLGSGSTSLSVVSNAASYQINIDPDAWPTYEEETISNWSEGFGFGWDNNGAGENGTEDASPFDGIDTPTDAYVCSGTTCQGTVEFTLDFHTSIDYSYEAGTYENTLTVEGANINF